LEGVADPRRGDRLPLEEHLFDACRLEAALRPHALEEREVSPLGAPEGEVLSQVELRGRQTPDQEIPNEILGLGQREIPGERNHEERFDPQDLDRLLLLTERLDAAGGVVWP